MRERRKCWVYKDQEFIKQFNSLQEASIYTHDGISAISQVLSGLRPMTRKGYTYTDHQLTAEERQSLPIKKEKIEQKKEPRYNDTCKQRIDYNLEPVVDCATHQVFLLERSKEARKQQLKDFIYKKLKYHWLTSDKRITAMEKQFIREILNSI